MVLDLLNSWSLISVVAEEFKDQVLEVLGKSSSVNLLEVSVVASLQEQVVEVFLLAGLLEWEDALNNDKDNDSNGEHVNLSSLVGLVLLDFWCHIGHGSSVTLKAIDALVASETEIGNLEVKVVGHEDVLELEVTVNNSLSVHVLHSVQNLVEEEPSGVFSHGPHCLAKVKEESSLDKLHDNEDKVVNDSA